MSRKILIGKVVSDKMIATVVVSVDSSKKHPIYGKAVKRTRRFKAHDELGAKDGDTVRIEETRPFSKEVTWKVIDIVDQVSERGKKK